MKPSGIGLLCLFAAFCSFAANVLANEPKCSSPTSAFTANMSENSDEGSEIPWHFEPLTDETTYYLYNIGTGKFLADDNSLTDYPAVAWTVTDNQIKSETGVYLSLTSKNMGSLLSPNWVITAVSNAEKPATSNIEPIDSAYYGIGNKVNVSTFSQQVRYLSVNEDGNLTYTSMANKALEANAQWLFVSQAQYETYGNVRKDAIEKLRVTLNAAKEVNDQITEVPGIVRTTLRATITAAETIIKREEADKWSWLLPQTSISTIKSTTTSLQSQRLMYPVLSDYYLACQDAIEKIERISSGLAFRALTTTAKESLEVSATQDAMKTAMTVLRAGVYGYLKTLKSISDGQEFTGLIGNHSFETGDSLFWTSLNLTERITGSDKNAKVVANTGENYVEEGDKKYYAESGSLMMQAVFGLPIGTYNLSAKMACKGSLLNLQRNVMMNVTTVPLSVLLELLKSVLPSTDNASDILEGITSGKIDVSQLLKNLKIEDLLNLLRSSETKSVTHSCSGNTAFSEADVEFYIDTDEVVLITLNTGLVPFVNVDNYRADDLKLTYVTSTTPTGIKQPQEEKSTTGGITYDLSGRRANNSTLKGIMIRDGKKFLK